MSGNSATGVSFTASAPHFVVLLMKRIKSMQKSPPTTITGFLLLEPTIF